MEKHSWKDAFWRKDICEKLSTSDQCWAGVASEELMPTDSIYQGRDINKQKAAVRKR